MIDIVAKTSKRTSISVEEKNKLFLEQYLLKQLCFKNISRV